MKDLYSRIKTFLADVMIRNYVLIVIILWLYIISISIMVLLLSWRFFDLILSLAVEDYTIKCLKNIIEMVAQPKFRSEYGMLEVQIVEEKWIMEAAFFKSYITKEAWITNFIKEINWPGIILRNDFDLETIKFVIREEYKEYITNAEESYNNLTSTADNIKFYKKDLVEVLSAFIPETFNIKEPLMNHCSNGDFIGNILNQVDWAKYIVTEDCQSKQFDAIKDLFVNKIQVLEYNFTTSKQHLSILLKEYTKSLTKSTELLELITSDYFLEEFFTSLNIEPNLMTDKYFNENIEAIKRNYTVFIINAINNDFIINKRINVDAGLAGRTFSIVGLFLIGIICIKVFISLHPPIVITSIGQLRSFTHYYDEYITTILVEQGFPRNTITRKLLDDFFDLLIKNKSFDVCLQEYLQTVQSGQWVHIFP